MTTIEEATKLLTQYIDYDAETPDYYEMEEACKVAINALEQQPCEDAISRQAVLDIIMPYCQDDDGSVENTGDLRNALDDIESLPPVTPKGKTGHWEYVPFDNNPNIGKYHCSECDRTTYFEYNYCPNCGARMQEVEENG